MGSGGGGAQKVVQETKTNSDPWGPQQDYLKYGFEQAKNLYTGYRPITGYTTTQTINPEWTKYQASLQNQYNGLGSGSGTIGAASNAGLGYQMQPREGGVDYYTKMQSMSPEDALKYGQQMQEDWLKPTTQQGLGAVPSQYITTETPIYGDQVGGQLKYYQGDSVADLNQHQQQTLADIWNTSSNTRPSRVYSENWVNDALRDMTPEAQYNRAVLTGDTSGQQYFKDAIYGNTNAQQYYNDVLAGKYLNNDYFKPGSNTNPYLSQMYNRAWTDTEGVLNSNLSKYGAYGGSDADNYRATTAGNMATDMYGKAYDQDMNRYLQYYLQNQGLMGTAAAADSALRSQAAQYDLAARNQAGTNLASFRNQAAAYVPQFQQMDYQNLMAKKMVGDTLQEQQQREIDALKARWDWEQMEPWDRLRLYQQAISGNYGGSSAGTETKNGSTDAGGYNFASGATGALGGAMSGAAVGSAVPGIGTAVGAGVGGLIGLLGGFR